MNTPTVSLSGITKRFGKQEVLRGVDLQVYPGEVVALIGPNGSGKSTLFKILSGLIQNYAGTISFLGKEEPRGIGHHHHAVFCFDSMPLFSRFTMPQNLALLSLLSKMTIQERDGSSSGPFPLDTLPAKKAVQFFSQGMKQQVLTQGLLSTSPSTPTAEVARQPVLYVLDEPTNSLDYQGVQRLEHWITSTVRDSQSSVLVSGHYLEMIDRISHRTVCLRDGRVTGTYGPGKERLEALRAQFPLSPPSPTSDSQPGRGI